MKKSLLAANPLKLLIGKSSLCLFFTFPLPLLNLHAESFEETIYPSYRQKLEIKEVIHKESTNHQEMILFTNDKFGVCLALDGAMQVTQNDEFIYHEILTNVPFYTHPKASSALVIGGGDGGIIRELLKHEGIKKVTLVELDDEVLRFSAKYLPFLSQGAFKDPRLKIIVEDGAIFVQRCKEKFDLIIIDSPDPSGEALALFSEDFYKNCKKLLNEDGIFVNQAGVPFMQGEELVMIKKGLSESFAHVDFFFAAIPSYVGGLMAFGIASERPIARKNMNPRKLEEITSLSYSYYNPEIHEASFAKPPFIKALLDKGVK